MHADNTFQEVLCTCVYSASKGNKLLRNTHRFNLRQCNFSKFPGVHAPRLPVLACFVSFACLCASHTMRVHIQASPTSTMITGLTVPPCLSKCLDPPVQGSQQVAMLCMVIPMVFFCFLVLCRGKVISYTRIISRVMHEIIVPALCQCFANKQLQSEVFQKDY